MNETVQQLLNNQGENYILPFFWQHGETEEVLREYMAAIDASNIKAVCVESRPHPDFCGEKWWQDMDVILDEARKRHMKVWILDDSHFPTGFANGALKDYPDCYCRQSICCRAYDLSAEDCAGLTVSDGGQRKLHIEAEQIAHPDPFEKNMIENFVLKEPGRVFDDDRLFSLWAIRRDENADGFSDPAWRIDLAPMIADGELDWEVPEGNWKVYALHLTRNMGFHRTYINMMDASSCHVLIDAVYEPHWEHYEADFGATIAGFFSDEPELGNGHLYDWNDPYGHISDYPWSEELETDLAEKMHGDAGWMLSLLFENDADNDLTAKVRYAFMDSVSSLVRKDFSYQLGDWCRQHGVQYIGHVIEDNNHHSRTASSLGHYFRGLQGQDMSGIDDIGGQVYPQGEHDTYDQGMFQARNGEFYHFVLGKLGASAAAIEPAKEGRAMCEIFGNYGWQEGVRLEKYLADHFLVRGINHYVPHAFTAKDYPDPDCPPHFYAHGHNPQYRHFGWLMKYMNRVCNLISGGHHSAPVAVIYSGEGDWTGKYMNIDAIGAVLTEHQIEYDIVPQDVFANPEFYRTFIGNHVLKVNTQTYRAVVVPYMQYITKALAETITVLNSEGIPVLFADKAPEGICDTPAVSADGIKDSRTAETDAALIAAVKKYAKVLPVSDLTGAPELAGIAEVNFAPADVFLRCYHYLHNDGSSVYMLVNEGTEVWRGTVTFAAEKENDAAVYGYDAWENICYPADIDRTTGAWEIALEPLQSRMVIFDATAKAADIGTKLCLRAIDRLASASGEEIALAASSWKRSTCAGIDYPAFENTKEISLPDPLAEEEPEFSGFVRYENTLQVDEKLLANRDQRLLLEITDAHEGVEVFVNDQSLGIQIVPTYCFDLTDALVAGDNAIRIEVATTLERENYSVPQQMGLPKPEPKDPSGISGEVHLYLV